MGRETPSASIMELIFFSTRLETVTALPAFHVTLSHKKEFSASLVLIHFG
jgi:hypothetical protein